MTVAKIWDGTQYVTVQGSPGPVGPKGDTGAAGTVYDSDQIGTVKAFSGKVIPTNWMLCDGTIVLRADYPQLADVMGVPVGQSAFGLPDLTERFILGAKSDKSDMYPTPFQSGERNVTLSMAQMPVHSHRQDGAGGSDGATMSSGPLDHQHTIAGGAFLTPSTGTPWVAQGSGGAAAYHVPNTGSQVGSIAHAHVIYPNGGGGSHNNMPPYTILAFIIKVTGVTINPGGALVGATGPPGTSTPPLEMTKTKQITGSGGAVVGYYNSDIEVFNAVVGDMRMTITPSVNIWWRVSYHSILTLQSDVGWVRCDLCVLLSSAYAAGGENADAQGIGQIRSIVRHALGSGAWAQGHVECIYKLQAGKTYGVGCAWRPTGTFNFGWYRAVEHLSGNSAIVGYW